MDTYADDLAELTEKLHLENAVHIGHSTGGGEVARYIGRHGKSVWPKRRRRPSRRDGKGRRAILAACRSVSSMAIRAGVQADRSQFFKELTFPFYGYNRPGAKTSEGVRESFGSKG